MTSLYHGALLFRVHLAGEELRLTSDYQLSRFFPLPAFPSPLWRVLAERVAHPDHTSASFVAAGVRSPASVAHQICVQTQSYVFLSFLLSPVCWMVAVLLLPCQLVGEEDITVA